MSTRMAASAFLKVAMNWWFQFSTYSICKYNFANEHFESWSIRFDSIWTQLIRAHRCSTQFEFDRNLSNDRRSCIVDYIDECIDTCWKSNFNPIFRCGVVAILLHKIKKTKENSMTEQQTAEFYLHLIEFYLIAHLIELFFAH